MSTASAETIVPRQKTGNSSQVASKKDCETRHDAILLFAEARNRLLNVNNWKNLCEKGAEFQLTDKQGTELYIKEAKVGCLIRISLPAPPNKKGGGYDWVEIEEIVHDRNLIKDEEYFGFRVRPVAEPLNNGSGPAHFFKQSATSTFLVNRNTNIVQVMEFGRNEKPQTFPGRIFNSIRNLFVAVGAMLGLSAVQWKCLVNGILHGESL